MILVEVSIKRELNSWSTMIESNKKAMEWVNCAFDKIIKALHPCRALFRFQVWEMRNLNLAIKYLIHKRINHGFDNNIINNPALWASTEYSFRRMVLQSRAGAPTGP